MCASDVLYTLEAVGGCVRHVHALYICVLFACLCILYNGFHNIGISFAIPHCRFNICAWTCL